MKFKRHFSIPTVCFLLLCATAIQAQEGRTVPEVSASGTSSVNVLPEVIRVVIPLQIQAKNMDEALANLKSEKESALKKLQDIGFEKDHIQFQNVGVDREWETKRRQMEAMINQRIMQPQVMPVIVPSSPDGVMEYHSPEPQATVPVLIPEAPTVLKQMIFADWPVKGKTSEDLLKESSDLMQKIKAIDFQPQKEMTPEEEELAEEMEGFMRNSHYSDESEQNNEPKFVYIAKLSDEKKQAAYQEACANAKKHAQTLAQLTGFELGMLKTLSGYHHAATPRDLGYSGNQDYQLIQMMSSQPSGHIQQLPVEGFSLTPEVVTFTISVQTAFTVDLFSLERKKVQFIEE